MERYKYSKKLEDPSEILKRWISENKQRFGVNNDYSYCLKDKKWYYYTLDSYMVYRDQIQREMFSKTSKETNVLAERLKRYDKNNLIEIKLPSIDEVLDAIYSTNDKDKRVTKTRPIWDFGDGLPAVNARYLRDMMGLFTETVVVTVGTPRDPLFFFGYQQEGLLFPVRKF